MEPWAQAARATPMDEQLLAASRKLPATSRLAARPIPRPSSSRQLSRRTPAPPPYPQGFPREYIVGVEKTLKEMIKGAKEIEEDNSFVTIETKVTITVD